MCKFISHPRVCISYLLWSLIVLCVDQQASAQSNTIFLTEANGATIIDYPFQFGRPFAQGEIPQFPSALINGTRIPTQVDVKKRYQDSSVRHAIISIIIPVLGANETVAISFENVPAPTADPQPVVVAQFLSTVPNFDALMNLTSRNASVDNVNIGASARSLLEAGNFSYWTTGNISTTMIVVDHNGTLDMGFMNSWKPFRPVFHITFWPSLNLTRVRFVGEISNAEKLQDMNYDIDLSIGGQLVFRDTDVPHRAGQRWTRKFWIPTAPPIQVNIDYNVPYLISTGVLPNYNLSVGLSPRAQVAQAYQQLLDSPYINKLLYSTTTTPCFGCFGPVSGEQGTPFSTLTLRWILCDRADWRGREVVHELYERFPMQVYVREGNPARRFDRTAGNTTDGIGRFINRWSRPGSWVFDGRDQSSDRITYIPPYLNMSNYPSNQTGLRNDFAIDVGSLQYFLSGDYYFLEQVQFHAAMATLAWQPRGPLNTFQASKLHRVDFWSRMTAAWISPDGTPEHRYFMNATLEHVGLLEGSKRILGTPLDGTPTKNHELASNTAPPNALWSYLNTGDPTDLRPNEGFQIELVRSRDRKPLAYWNLAALAVAKERGFGNDVASPSLLSMWTDKFLGGQFREVGTYNRVFSFFGVQPIVWFNGTFVRSFTESLLMIPQSIRDSATTIDTGDAQGSSALEFCAVASLLVDQAPPYSISAWNWCQRYIRPFFSDASFALYYKTNIVPRLIPSYPAFCGSPPAPEAECIGNNSWIVLPFTGILSSRESIRLSTVVIVGGQTVTLGGSGNITVAGNFSVGCNSTLINQGSQINVNGGSAICGTLQLTQLDPSKTSLTTASCVNFTNAQFVLNASSLASNLNGDVTINVAQFSCNSGTGLGRIELQATPEDCRAYALAQNQPSRPNSLSVLINISPCASGAPMDAANAFPLIPVVGGVVGGVVAVAIIVTVSVLLYRRSKFRKNNEKVKTRLSIMSSQS